MKNTQYYWKRLNIALGLSTIIFFLVSYDIAVELDLFLFFVLVIGYIICTIFLIVAIRISFTSKLPPPKMQIVILFTFIISSFINYEIRNGAFSGKKYLEAAFLDERSRMDLTLFENKNFRVDFNWMIGEETFTGTYSIHSDTIQFNKCPMIEGGILPNKLLRRRDKLFFSYDKSGFDTTTSFYYFQIDYNKLKRKSFY